jgi:hypothetical protein
MGLDQLAGAAREPSGRSPHHAQLPAKHSAKEPFLSREARPACDGPDRFRVPLLRRRVDTSSGEAETVQTGGLKASTALDDDRLEEDRVLAEHIGLDDRAVLRLHFGRGRLEDYGPVSGRLHHPYGSTAPHQDSDWKLLVCPANLHVAVGKAESQDRLWGDAVFIGHDLPTLPTTACLGASGIPPIGYWFDSHDEGLIARLAHDPPQPSPPLERFTDLRRTLLRDGAHLEVPVRITDLEQAAGHGRSVPTG